MMILTSRSWPCDAGENHHRFEECLGSTLLVHGVWHLKWVSLEHSASCKDCDYTNAMQTHIYLIDLNCADVSIYCHILSYSLMIFFYPSSPWLFLVCIWINPRSTKLPSPGLILPSGRLARCHSDSRSLFQTAPGETAQVLYHGPEVLKLPILKTNGPLLELMRSQLSQQ